jgi:hypothetical protein
MPTKALQKTSTKEVDLANTLTLLTEPELAAYKHFVNSGQQALSEEIADQMFRLFHRGQTTREIQKLFPQYSWAKIVAARVLFKWDERKDTEVANLKVEVPAKVETTHLETQEFLSNLLHASHKKFNDALKRYIATGDAKILEESGVPLPSSLKELSALIDMYMKISGTDSKKVDVRVAGGVAHAHVHAKVKPEDAEKVMDDLLNSEPVQDAHFEPVEEAEDELAEQKESLVPTRSPEDMIKRLVDGGMPQERAEQVVKQMKKND